MLQQKDIEQATVSNRATRWRLFKLALYMVGLITVAGAAGWSWQTFGPQDKEAAGSKNIVVVKRGPLDIKISATGVIRPFHQVKVSPKNTGLLEKLLVNQGDYVRKGQVIAVMDDSNLVGQVQAAEAAYLAAKANYEKALHGNRPQEVADALAQKQKAESAVAAAQNAVARSQADLKAMQAQLVRDETNAARLSQLAREGAISDQDRLNAITQAEVTRAQLDRTQQELHQAASALVQAQADLSSAAQRYDMIREGTRPEDLRAAEQAMIQALGNFRFLKSQLEDTRIRAPFDGVITQKYTDHGAIVTPTTSAATNSATSSSIVSLAGRLELVAAVAETDIEHISLGQPVVIVANAYPDRTFHGTVCLIAPEAIVEQNVTSFEVHATIDDDPDRLLMSGMNVNALFTSGRKEEVLLVPTAAVVSKQGKTGVFAPGADGKPEFRPIKVGFSSGTTTSVIDGLEEGDRVFLGLTKDQLVEQGYQDTSVFGGGKRMSAGGQKGPPVPRQLGGRKN